MEQEAVAACGPTPRKVSETEAFDSHGCRVDFIQWSAMAYQLMDEDWNALGYRDACNLDREYTKHWNATAIISWAIGPSTPFSRPFHFALEDYTQEARARESDEWHDNFRHIEVDSIGTAFAAFTPRGFTLVNLVKSTCRLYATSTFGTGTLASPTDDPIFRAGSFVHEAWHAWKDEHDIANPSQNGGHAVTGATPTGTGACGSGANCDYYYPHLKGDYQPGELYKEKRGHGKSHSVFQTQLEFLCDIADNPAPQVPFVNREVAARAAGFLRTTVFVNTPPFACGSPELISSLPIGNPEPPCGVDGGAGCAVDSDCNSITLECNNGCCTDRVK